MVPTINSGGWKAEVGGTEFEVSLGCEVNSSPPYAT